MESCPSCGWRGHPTVDARTIMEDVVGMARGAVDDMRQVASAGFFHAELGMHANHSQTVALMRQRHQRTGLRFCRELRIAPLVAIATSPEVIDDGLRVTARRLDARPGVAFCLLGSSRVWRVVSSRDVAHANRLRRRERNRSCLTQDDAQTGQRASARSEPARLRSRVLAPSAGGRCAILRIGRRSAPDPAVRRPCVASRPRRAGSAGRLGRLRGRLAA